MVIGAPMNQPNARSTPRAAAASEPSASQQIDARIQSDDWRGEALSNVRALIRKAAPDVVETWKWRGVPVLEDHGILYRRDLQGGREVDLRQGRVASRSQGCSTPVWKATPAAPSDLHEGDTSRATAFKALIRAAIARKLAR